MSACRVGLKNMDSSSGWAMSRMTRLPRRDGGIGGTDEAVICQRAKKRNGRMVRVSKVGVFILLVSGSFLLRAS